MGQKIASLYAEIGADTSKLEKGLDTSKSKLKDTASVAGQAKLRFTELKSAFDLAGQGLTELGRLYGDTVNATVAYDKTVRDLAQNLNVGTEETSRLIQAADDYGIEVGQLQVALQMALKNGFAPSVETLAQMADRYNAIQDPTQRAAELTKVFGRNWAALTPMLKEGGNAIRANADAQAANLIRTKEQVQASRDYEIAVDNLNDSLTGLKYNLSTGIIPSITKLLDLFSGPTSQKAADFINTVFKGTFLESGLSKQLRAATEAGTDVVDMAEQIRKKAVPSLEDLASAEDAVQKQMDELKTFMAGPLGNENKNYESDLSDLNLKLEGLVRQAGNLKDLKYRTPDQQQELDDLTGQIGEVTAKIDETRLAHDKATKEILFNIMQQIMAQDGLSTKEGAVLMKWASDNGMIDQSTYQMWQNYQTYLAGGVDATTKSVDQIVNDLNRIPKTIDVQVMIHTSGGGEVPIWDYTPTNPYETSTGYDDQTPPVNNPRGNKEYASGADFIIPPGYNENFPIGPNGGASSGERVTVTPKGQSAGININGPVTVVANDPKEFMRKLGQFAKQSRSAGMAAAL